MTQNWCGTRVPYPLLVTGKILFPEGTKFTDGLAFVRLEDTSLSDAPAVTIIEEVISGIDPDEENEYDLSGELPPSGASYTVSVHVKIHQNPIRPCDLSAQTIGKKEAIEVGDFINVQSYPVTFSADVPVQLDIEVKPV